MPYVLLQCVNAIRISGEFSATFSPLIYRIRSFCVTMGQNTSVQCGEQKSIEYNIFDKSFALIEKYNKDDAKGLRDAFNREYEWNTINEGDGDLNWHKIMPKHMQVVSSGISTC